MGFFVGITERHEALAGCCSGGESRSRFNGFGGGTSHRSKAGKPLKRLCSFACQDTRLKPGANEMGNRLQETELRPRPQIRCVLGIPARRRYLDSAGFDWNRLRAWLASRS